MTARQAPGGGGCHKQTEKRESDMTTRIIGIGSYVPDTVVTNKDLMEFLDTDDAWILSLIHI